MNRTIGVACHGQAGDLMTAMSVLRWRKELWGDAKIVWWAAPENVDLLAFQPNLEIRPFPRGWGHPDLVLEANKSPNEPLWCDWSTLPDSENRLNLSPGRASEELPEFGDVDIVYFPAPHQMSPEKRHGLTYPEVSQRVFGCQGKSWHPYLKFSTEERVKAWDFVNGLTGRRVFIETFAGSGQSSLDENMIVGIMDDCVRKWGECTFIFGSHKFLRGQEQFPDYLLARIDTTSCASFTPRQTALISTACDLFISVSSGLTVAASAWDLPKVPIIQYCGSEICGTRLLARGPFEMITADDKPLDASKEEFFVVLNNMLNQYK